MTAFLIVIIVTRAMSFLGGIDTMAGPKPDKRWIHVVGLILDGSLIAWAGWLLTRV